MPTSSPLVLTGHPLDFATLDAIGRGALVPVPGKAGLAKAALAHEVVLESMAAGRRSTAPTPASAP